MNNLEQFIAQQPPHPGVNFQNSAGNLRGNLQELGQLFNSIKTKPIPQRDSTGILNPYNAQQGIPMERPNHISSYGDLQNQIDAYLNPMILAEGRGRAPASVEQTPLTMNQLKENYTSPAKAVEQKKVKTAEQRKQEMLSDIDKFMQKKKELAIDTQARLDKLNAQYGNRGNDYTGVLKGLEYFAGAKPGTFTEAYKEQRPMQEDEYRRLREGLANKLDKQYGSLLNEAQQMSNQKDLRQKWTLDALQKNAKVYDEKPLSDGSAKRYQGLHAMYDPLIQIQKLTAGPNGGFSTEKVRAMTRNNNWIADNKLGAAIRMFSEAYGRMQSGAAIKEDEEKRFAASIFKAGDSPELIKYKIDLMKQYLKRGAEAFMVGRSPQNPAYAGLVKMMNFKPVSFNELSPEDQAKAQKAAADMASFKFKTKGKSLDELRAELRKRRGE